MEEKIIKDRIKKIKEIKELGINPYPYSFNQKDYIKDILEKNKSLKKEEENKKSVTIAGRILTLRNLGKIAFGNIQDQTGNIQFFISKGILKEQYKLFKLLDRGDIVGLEGTIFRTKAGEITIKTNNLTLLTKTTRPLPEKWHGLKDPELKYRERYVDMIMDPKIREIFQKRSQIISAMREFLNSKGFIELEIPLIQPIYGGANARPFKTHINAWNMDMYLSISPELYLKRLIVGGIEKVYTISKSFRNEGVDRTHNPEFTTMESYEAYADYNKTMELTEQMYEYIAKKVLKTTKINYQGKEINLKTPWKRLTTIQAIKKHADINIEKLSDKEIQEILKRNKIVLENYNRGIATELIFEELVESKLLGPVFITDHPKETTPLCKIHRKNNNQVERFEPFIAGFEIANGYSELNDPVLQKKLLEEQAEQLRAGSAEAHPMDEDFIRAIEYGMPPTGGVGISIDRMIMLFTNSRTIRDVIPFPTMKPKK